MGKGGGQVELVMLALELTGKREQHTTQKLQDYMQVLRVIAYVFDGCLSVYQGFATMSQINSP